MIRFVPIYRSGISALDGPYKAIGKVRYSHKGAKCTLIPLEDGRIKCVFEEPQRAMTPGQAAVFYQDDYTMGVAGAPIC